MKKKLILIISILVSIAVIGTISYILITNNKNKEEYNKNSKKYDNYIEIANKINSIIDENVKPIDEVVKKDIGEDKTKIDELNNKKDELLKFKINVDNKKSKNLTKIKEQNKKLEKALNNIDKNLINLKDKEIKDYKLNEENQINVISNEINTLIQEINELANKLEEKKKQQEIEEKILSGDLSYFAGTYKMFFYDSRPDTIIISNDGGITMNGGGGAYKDAKPTSVTKRDDGSYYCLIKNKQLIDGSATPGGITIYPVGVKSNMSNEDVNKVRIEDTTDGVSVSGGYVKTD